MERFQGPGNGGEPGYTPEDFDRLRRRLSKAALYAAQRSRQPLFDKLTARNAASIRALSQVAPDFVERDPTAPTRIDLDQEITDLMPADFFDDPSGWLESQRNIDRDDEVDASLTAATIDELWTKAYDRTRVKEFVLQGPDGPIPVVSKRLSRAHAGTAEVAIHRRAYEAGIPTVRVFGEVSDMGNEYFFMEKWPGMNLVLFSNWLHGRRSEARVFRDKIRGLRASGTEDAAFEAEGFLAAEIVTLKEMFAELEAREEHKNALHAISAIVTHIQHAVAYGKPLEPFPYLQPTLASRDVLEEGWGVSTLSELSKLPYAALGERLASMRKEILRPYRSIESNIAALCYSVQFRQPQIVESEVERQISEMGAACTQAGVTHKDLEARNILVHWDFERNEPILDENGKLVLKLIDWEPITGDALRL